jgi:hypothetical protein
MKITFEFDGDDSHEEAKMVFLARDFYSALWDIDQRCRTRMKYEENVSDEEYKLMEELREMCSPIRDFE